MIVKLQNVEFLTSDHFSLMILKLQNVEFLTSDHFSLMILKLQRVEFQDIRSFFSDDSKIAESRISKHQNIIVWWYFFDSMWNFKTSYYYCLMINLQSVEFQDIVLLLSDFQKILIDRHCQVSQTTSNILNCQFRFLWPNDNGSSDNTANESGSILVDFHLIIRWVGNFEILTCILTKLNIFSVFNDVVIIAEEWSKALFLVVEKDGWEFAIGIDYHGIESDFVDLSLLIFSYSVRSIWLCMTHLDTLSTFNGQNVS